MDGCAGGEQCSGGEKCFLFSCLMSSRWHLLGNRLACWWFVRSAIMDYNLFHMQEKTDFKHAITKIHGETKCDWTQERKILGRSPFIHVHMDGKRCVIWRIFLFLFGFQVFVFCTVPFCLVHASYKVPGLSPSSFAVPIFSSLNHCYFAHDAQLSFAFPVALNCILSAILLISSCSDWDQCHLWYMTWIVSHSLTSQVNAWKISKEAPLFTPEIPGGTKEWAELIGLGTMLQKSSFERMDTPVK